MIVQQTEPRECSEPKPRVTVRAVNGIFQATVAYRGRFVACCTRNHLTRDRAADCGKRRALRLVALRLVAKGEL